MRCCPRFACWVAWTGCVLSACSATTVGTVEYLDEVSAATVFAVGTPLVFARARPELAAHARDYLRLVAVDINRAGRHDQWVLVYMQSLDAGFASGSAHRAPDTLFVRADDRDVQLIRTRSTGEEAGVTRRVHAPRGVRDGPVVYRVEPDALAFVAGAKHLTLRVDSLDGARFELWSDGRESLTDFVRSSRSAR